MDVKKSKKWNAADWDYGALQAERQMGPLWGRLDGKEIDRRLQAIARRCPQFYPAILELGLRRLSEKGGAAAERMVEEGFRLLLDFADPEHAAEEIDGVIQNLEMLWRFDLSKRLLEILDEQRGLSAEAHDSLAHAEARLGDLKAAQRHIDRALELVPDRKAFWSNKGWYHLMAGETEEAGKALDRALRLKPRDPVASGNRKIQEYLAAHGGTFQDYLERPLDRKEIEYYTDRKQWDRVAAVCDDFNSCRLEAFAQAMFLEGGKKRSRLPSVLGTLRSFFHFVSRLDASGSFLNEDIAFVSDNFKTIMHRFIFKFGDVDRTMMLQVFESLLAFYGFLASRRLVARADFDLFRATVRQTKDELLDKMERYNAVRHDPAVSEEKKEKIRQRLFEGDHLWPYI